MGLLYKILGGAVLASAALTSRVDAGTLSGRLTDMFSRAPYNGATITAVNESNQEAYKATSGSNATAVEPTSWGRIKSNFMIPTRRVSGKIAQLESALNDGFYTLELPDGNYTVAFTDGNPGVAKPTSGDLANLQIGSGDRFYPRTVRLGVKDDTRYDETLLPKDFDLEYAWTVLDGKICRADYDNMRFYIDESPARDDWIPSSSGRMPQTQEIGNVVKAIEEFVRISTGGTKTPKIEVGRSPPKDDVVNPANGGLMVEPGYTLIFWDDSLKFPKVGGGGPWVDQNTGRIISSYARFMPGAGLDMHTVLNEVLASGGLSREPGLELDRRIRDTGGSIFLDTQTGDVNVDHITERDAQIIQFHGQRPLLTKPVDLTEAPFESVQ